MKKPPKHTKLEKEFKDLQQLCFELFQVKHKAYGPNNVWKLGFLGILARCEEKIERIKHMCKHEVISPETVNDSLRDISNLAIIAELFISSKWPPKE